MKHSVEQLQLLQNYIVIFSVILGIPGISLLLKKDKRYKLAWGFYGFMVILFVFLYHTGNKIFFPDITITKK